MPVGTGGGLAADVDVWISHHAYTYPLAGQTRYISPAGASSSTSAGGQWLGPEMPRRGRIKSIRVLTHNNQLAGAETLTWTVMKSLAATPTVGAATDMTLTTPATSAGGSTSLYRSFTGGPVTFEAGDRVWIRTVSTATTLDRQMNWTLVVEVEYF